MKPRIEKKLSKQLVAIFQGTPKFSDAWIDKEYSRDTHYPHQRKKLLSPAQLRHNRSARVSVNNIPSVGGELDHFGEGTDWCTVHAAYSRELAEGVWYEDELFGLSYRHSGQPALTAAEQARLDVLSDRAKQLSKHLRRGRTMLAHARKEASGFHAK